MKRVAATILLLALASLALAQPKYFIKADAVRGAQGAQGAVCVPNSVFFPGEMVVFRAEVYDAATGEELSFDQIQERGITATVKLDNGESVEMFFPPPEGEGPPPAEGEEGPPPGANLEFFRGPWAIPADFPTGLYNWTIEVTDAEGNTAEFEPIGATFGAGGITIQAATQ